MRRAASSAVHAFATAPRSSLMPAGTVSRSKRLSRCTARTGCRSDSTAVAVAGGEARTSAMSRPYPAARTNAPVVGSQAPSVSAASSSARWTICRHSLETGVSVPARSLARLSSESGSNRSTARATSNISDAVRAAA